MPNDLNITGPGAPQKAALTPLERAKKLTQGLLAAAVVIFVAGAGGIYLILSKIQATQKLAASRTALAGSSQIVASRYQATMDTYNQDEGQLRFLEASVSQQEYVPTLLQQLQTLAASAGLSVTSVRPGDASDSKAPARAAATGPSDPGDKKAAPPPYTIQTITVSVTGTYPQLMRFIYGLPHFPKILSLHSINLHPDAATTGTDADDPSAKAQKKDSEPKLGADIALDAYVFNADPAPVAAPQTPQPGSFSDVRHAQADVLSQTAGRAVGTARQDAQTENAIHAQTPIAAPVAPTGRL